MSRPLVMGVLNVTPDSFSDGGEWLRPADAVAHGLELRSQGADLLDVGGESTRPGAERSPESEESARVLPVVRELAAAGCRVSVDTMRASVAARAIEAGAVMINDVSGGLADPEMASMAAQSGVPFVAMHWRGHSADMQSRAIYLDVVADVATELRARAEGLMAAGIAKDKLVLDPGFGFAKLAGHNWSLLRHLDRLTALGFPVLVGTSRKGFLGPVGRPDGSPPRPPRERDAVTAATSLYAALSGVWGVRVHDVRSTVEALGVAVAIQEAP